MIQSPPASSPTASGSPLDQPPAMSYGADAGGRATRKAKRIPRPEAEENKLAAENNKIEAEENNKIDEQQPTMAGATAADATADLERARCIQRIIDQSSPRDREAIMQCYGPT